MSLDKYTYKEYQQKVNHWEIIDVTFTNFNLIVGKNSSGKSRLLKTISALGNILSGRRTTPFDDCEWVVELTIDKKKFVYEVKFKNDAVFMEKLTVQSQVLLIRNEDGTGEIRYEKLGTNVEFKLPGDVLVAASRRDEVQHPFLIQLTQWAENVVLYEFGSEFGRSQAMPLHEVEAIANNKSLVVDDINLVVKAYASAYTQYQEKFDKAIITDMKTLGYNIVDVGADNLQSLIAGFPVALLTMYTVEKDLNFRNPQTQMSQGMWRALALVIHLNICTFSKYKELILIDDIGEGLDFSRSTAVVDLLVKKAKKNSFQLITTSNDRFVMNNMPLEYWSVIKRKKGTVKVFNKENSPKIFERFKYLGLNNFDFFASNFFEQ
jgi:AAA15 family ATPase/GTPase